MIPPDFYDFENELFQKLVIEVSEEISSIQNNALIFNEIDVLSSFSFLAISKKLNRPKIKDSSSLIPGHGGFYDRLDSLLFLAPFFVISIYSF